MKLNKIFSILVLAVVVISATVFITSCPSKNPLDFKDIEDCITVTAQEKYIGEENYKVLEVIYHQKGGEGDFEEYLRDLLDSNECEDVKIRVPQPQPQKPVIAAVYLDNTSSMKGFLESTSGSVNELVDLFNKLRSLEGDETHAYYIDKKGLTKTTLKDMANSINDKAIKTQDAYIMSEFLDTVVSQTLRDTIHDVISYFVSDAIMSGTNKEIRMNPRYNKDHANTLSTNVAQVMSKLKGKDYGVMIMRFEGEFDGNYITYDNKGERIKSQRPFYVIAIGPSKNIVSLNSQIKENGVFKPTNLLTAATHPSAPKVTVSSEGVNCDIEGNVFKLKSNQDKPQVRLKFNLSSLPEYMADETTARRALKVKFNNEDMDLSDASYDNSSNILSVDRYLVEPKTEFPFEVRVEKTFPAWISAYDTNDDKNIQSQIDKTFNLKFLVDGLISGIYNLPAGDLLIEGSQKYVIENNE